MRTIYAHENGTTRCVDRVDPNWLRKDSGVWVWVDMVKPEPEEVRMLNEVFHFHDLAIEDAVSEIHHPKIESYGDFLYVILHGIDFKAREHLFHTQDVDFFLGQVVEFVDQLIDLAVGGVDPALKDGSHLWVGFGRELFVEVEHGLDEGDHAGVAGGVGRVGGVDEADRELFDESLSI